MGAVEVNGYTIEPEADLRGAFLSGANLTRANLSHANLSHADLSGANLTGANAMRSPSARRGRNQSALRNVVR